MMGQMDLHQWILETTRKRREGVEAPQLGGCGGGRGKIGDRLDTQ